MFPVLVYNPQWQWDDEIHTMKLRKRLTRGISWTGEGNQYRHWQSPLVTAAAALFALPEMTYDK